MTLTRRAVLGGIALAVSGCAAPMSGPTGVTAQAFASTSGQDAIIARLEAALLALGPDILPEEAARVAQIAVREPLDWAQAWRVEDPPLIHNIKVNSGTRPRGLCKHWADDLEARLLQEGLQSFSLHRAIANADRILIDHSTVIITRRDAPMNTGLVLDPWRSGQGRLWFGRVTEDPKYHWVPRAEVFAMKRERAARRKRAGLDL